MTSIFEVDHFEFPYRYKFPGQASDESLLFVTRENPVMLTVRRAGVLITAATLLLAGAGLGQLLETNLGVPLSGPFLVLALAIAVAFALVGWWWVTTLWMKSLAVVTTQRLAKCIYTTPFNRHILSLPLDMIVDTGSYTKGFLQAAFKLGTFTARSSASSSGASTDDNDRINKKYFYIENIAIAEDLQHYINKVLYAFRHHHEHLPSFRPFIPHLKGEARKEFMTQHPDYWS
jgi:hypothetical protein